MYQYLCSVEQIFALVRTKYTKLNTMGSLNFGLGIQLAECMHEDPPYS